MNINPGDEYTRKFGDQQTVKIKKVFEEDNEILITDCNGAHFIRIDQLATHFIKVEDEETEEA